VTVRFCSSKFHALKRGEIATLNVNQKPWRRRMRKCGLLFRILKIGNITRAQKVGETGEWDEDDQHEYEITKDEKRREELRGKLEAFDAREASELRIRL
jgi:hypothetical protein